jgi:hypothetical protein
MRQRAGSEPYDLSQDALAAWDWFLLYTGIEIRYLEERLNKMGVIATPTVLYLDEKRFHEAWQDAAKETHALFVTSLHSTLQWTVFPPGCQVPMNPTSQYLHQNLIAYMLAVEEPAANTVDLSGQISLYLDLLRNSGEVLKNKDRNTTEAAKRMRIVGRTAQRLGETVGPELRATNKSAKGDDFGIHLAFILTWRTLLCQVEEACYYNP